VAKGKMPAEMPESGRPTKEAASPIPAPALRHGPRPAAGAVTSRATMPGDGNVPAVRAAGMFAAGAQRGNAPGRARMMSAMQRTVGNAGLSRRMSGTQPIQRRCTCAEGDGEGGGMAGECECHAKATAREEEPVQRRAAAIKEPAQAMVPPAVTSALRAGGGRPLDAAVGGRMERALGADLSTVRIHTDARAAVAARAVKADAFTSGQDVYFGSGRYQPDTAAGDRLLAHELAHTLQRADGGTTAQASGPISRPSDPEEREAEQVAGQVMSGQPVTDTVVAAAAPQATPAIARQADDEEPATPPAPEPYEGANLFRAKSLELQGRIGETMAIYADAVVHQDYPWHEYQRLKQELATLKREKFLVDYFMLNPQAWQSRGERAEDALQRAHTVAQTEVATINLLHEEGGGDTDLISHALLQMPDLFPEYTIGLYRAAVAEFEARAEERRARFEGAVADLTKRPPEQIVPDFIWLLDNQETLRRSAGHISFFTWLDEEAPIFLEKRVPNATSVGIDDLQVRLNEQQINWAQFTHPDLRDDLAFLYPALEDWYFYQLYDRLARQMDLFRIVVEATYERLNEPGTMPDVVADLHRTYHSQAPQVTRSTMEEGFRTIFDAMEGMLNRWVAGMSWDERIREGFGLYDVYGEIGTQLKQLATPQAILMMVGFIAFLIGIQFVPFANLVVDAILLSLGAIDILKGVGIFGYYFDTASEATTFRQLRYAAQGLRGGGEAILNLLFELIGLAASRAIRAYTRYRGANQFKNLDDIAQHEVITRGSDDVRRAYREARASGREFSRWERTLNEETRRILEADPDLRRIYAEMNPTVRQLLTLCASECISPRSRPTPDDISRIETLISRFSLPPNHRGLREFLHHPSRRDNLTRALDELGDVQSVAELEARLNRAIAANVREAGATASIVAGRWEYRRPDGTVIREYEVATHGNLSVDRGTGGFFQSHHGIQGEWARQRVPGYSYDDSPAILLRDSRSGTPHRIVTDRQLARRAGRQARTYAEERQLLRQDMDAAGVPRTTADTLLSQSDEYFAQLYRQHEQALLGQNLPAATRRRRLREIFGDWSP
jgi:hypothetical protein